jgi:hypothetical protein
MTTAAQPFETPVSVVPASNPRPRLQVVDSGVSRRAIWTGRVLSGIALAFMTWDASFKVLEHPLAVQGTIDLGYPAAALFGIGLVELICVALYAIPRVAPIGAILLTGYLGGAIATHVRLDNPLFSHVLFPIYVAAFIWGGLWLRDQRVRGLLR